MRRSAAIHAAAVASLTLSGEIKSMTSITNRPSMVNKDPTSEESENTTFNLPDVIRVLDVGCGYGTLHPLFGQQVEHYTGFDWAEAVIRERRAAA